MIYDWSHLDKKNWNRVQVTKDTSLKIEDAHKEMRKRKGEGSRRKAPK
jgi:hypothetical protein